MTSNKKTSYIEPMNAPIGRPCRFCDMPNNVNDLGPVVQDGVAVDGETQLFSHKKCLMTSGGKNPSLEPIKPEEKDDIWAFANKSIVKIDATPEEVDKSLELNQKSAPITQTDATQPYVNGAPVAPTH